MGGVGGGGTGRDYPGQRHYDKLSWALKAKQVSKGASPDFRIETFPASFRLVGTSALASR